MKQAQNLSEPILEVAILQIKTGQTREFEQAFARAQTILVSRTGYIKHELQACLEDNHRYILLVQWQTLEDHTQGFRGSAQYQQWKELLHHFYDPFPTVEHYRSVF